MTLLPRANGDTLLTLLEFLATVAQHSADTTLDDGVTVLLGNKMDSHNLATLFAPNLLHKAKATGDPYEVELAERAEESDDVIAVVHEMIDNCHQLSQVRLHCACSLSCDHIVLFLLAETGMHLFALTRSICNSIAGFSRVI